MRVFLLFFWIPAEDVRWAPGAVARGGQRGCSRSLAHSPSLEPGLPKMLSPKLEDEVTPGLHCSKELLVLSEDTFSLQPWHVLGSVHRVPGHRPWADPSASNLVLLRCLCSDLSPSLPRPCSKQAIMAEAPFGISSLPEAAQLFYCWSLS